MKILYVISLICFVILAVAAFAMSRHIRHANAAVTALEEKKPVRSAGVPRSRSAQRRLRRAS